MSSPDCYSPTWLQASALDMSLTSHIDMLSLPDGIHLRPMKASDVPEVRALHVRIAPHSLPVLPRYITSLSG